MGSESGSGACSGDSTGLVNGQPIHLTQAEATALDSQVTKLAPVFPELAFLADSVSVVLQAGAEADPVDITTDLGAGPFYAVGLQRAFSNGATSFTTFDFIAFNDPSNPTDFIIVDGYAPVIAQRVAISMERGWSAGEPHRGCRGLL